MMGVRKQVTQFQFTSWPDHGVPEYAGPLLAYQRRIKAKYRPSKGPLLVHCRLVPTVYSITSYMVVLIYLMLYRYMQCWDWQDRYSDRYRHCSRAGHGREGGYSRDSLQDEGPEDEDGADCCKTEAPGVNTVDK